MTTKRPSGSADRTGAAGSTPAPEAPVFHVGDHGSPVLEGQAPPVDPGGIPETEASAGGATTVVVEELWSPEEAQRLLHVIWNLGFFFYGVDWLATNADFKMSSANVARRLDQFLPKSSSGGAVGVGLDVFLAISDVTGSIALRRELIKAGPRQLNDIMAEAQKAPAPGPSSASPAPPAPPRAAPRPASTPATPAAAGDGGFAFDPKMRALIDASPLDGIVYTEGME